MKIGIIGGTGVYDPDLLKDARKEKIKTEFGDSSDEITTGVYEGVPVAILPRHGSKHSFNPSKVNYRANIDAMKQLGVTHIIAITAVGSLKEEIKPGDFVITDQFFDRTTKRESTFYDKDKVCHIGVAKPFCPDLRKIIIKETKELGFPIHENGTCVVIEGPRFSTKAESRIFKSWGADTVNMTMVPEVVLAREAEICYANISMVTDYDVWKEHSVTIEGVIEIMKKNDEKVNKLLTSVISNIPKKRSCDCQNALKDAFIG